MKRSTILLYVTHLVLLCISMLLSACAAQPSPAASTSATQAAPTDQITSASGTDPTASPRATVTTSAALTTVPTVLVSSPTALAEPTTPQASVAPASEHPAWVTLTGNASEVAAPISLLDADTGQMVEVCFSTIIVGASEAVWSPQGQWLACPNGIGEPISLVNSTTLETYDVAAISDPASFAWSPDGQVLAVSMRDRIMLVSPTNPASPRVLKECQEYNCSALAFSPDGQLLATNNHQGLTVLALATGKETLLSDVGIFFSGDTPDSRDVISPLKAVAFSPDSQWVAYTAMGGIFVVSATGGEVRRLISPEYLGDDTYDGRNSLQWSEDSTRIRFARDGFVGLLETPIDGSGTGYGDQVTLPPLPGGSLLYRCSGIFQATGRRGITIASGVELEVVLEDLFLQFTSSEARVQMTEGAFEGPQVEDVSTSKARFRGDLAQSAWAPGPIRAPTLALSDPPMRGCAVLELQTILKNRGLDSGSVDGIYGPTTETAVRAFQQANNLGVDGIVGATTWAALGGWTWER